MTLRARVQQLVETSRFQHFVMAVIIVNAVTLGAETSPRAMATAGGLLFALDRIALTIFVVELLGKFYAYRWRFFRDPWNVFDFVVVAIALIPATGAFSVLRALRVLRILRLISIIPSMRRVVATLLAALPGVSSIVGLLLLVIYVGAVMATKLFGESTPQYFGDLGTSLWTLFQVMTGESWPEIANTVMAEQPMAWIFFLIFILISTFVVLNLFLAVMVNAMENVREQDQQHQREKAAAREAAATDRADAMPAGGTAAGGTRDRAPLASEEQVDNRALLAELTALRSEVTALREQLRPAGDRPD